MKHLDKKATKIFLTLTQGLPPFRSRKIDRTQGFMAAHVERLSEDPEVYSIAHYYEQNGDLVQDPDVELLVVRARDARGEKVGVFPFAFQQGGRFYARYAEPLGGGKIKRLEAGQDDLAEFCNGWLRNIAVQQRLDEEPLPAFAEDADEEEEHESADKEDE